MTHQRRTEGRVVVVAGRALGAARNVGGRLAQCSCAVMTGGTGANGGRIVGEGNGRPANGGLVTAVALGRSGHVSRGLHLGIDGQIRSAMAGRTVVGDVNTRAAVIHLGRSESGGYRVADIAGHRGRQMSNGLAEGIYAVVAGRAATGDDTRMVIDNRLPGGRIVVAGVTLRGRRNMSSRFRQGIDRHVGATMAGRTVAGGHRSGGAGVAHRGRREGCEYQMTTVALGSGRNVCARLAQSRGAVVARRATAGHCRRCRRVIEGGTGPGSGGTVAAAAVTLRRRRDVRR